MMGEEQCLIIIGIFFVMSVCKLGSKSFSTMILQKSCQT